MWDSGKIRLCASEPLSLLANCPFNRDLHLGQRRDRYQRRQFLIEDMILLHVTVART
jgi:hypothetical protein